MLHVLRVPDGLRQIPVDAIAGALLAVAAAVILGALAFEHIGGYVPCSLCLQQRYAYYAGIPALAAAIALLRFRNAPAAIAILLLVGTGFLVNAGLGIRQAGAEWKLWEIASCGAGGDFQQLDLANLNLERVALCDIPSWRFLGLSFAGWNVVFSALLAAGAFTAVIETWRRAR
jgi:disulfide bond formation protein DsbB